MPRLGHQSTRQPDKGIQPVDQWVVREDVVRMTARFMIPMFDAGWYYSWTCFLCVSVTEPDAPFHLIDAIISGSSVRLSTAAAVRHYLFGAGLPSWFLCILDYIFRWQKRVPTCSLSPATVLATRVARPPCLEASSSFGWTMITKICSRSCSSDLSSLSLGRRRSERNTLYCVLPCLEHNAKWRKTCGRRGKSLR